MIGSERFRLKKFSAKNIFSTLCQLVTSTNNNGYTTALLNAFSEDCSRATDLPSKTAFSQIRKRIKSDYFKDIFSELIVQAQPHKKTWEGLYVYAIDGIQLTLPRAGDIMTAAYNGRKVSKIRESYMPRMYLTHAYDVLNGVSKDLRESPVLNEIADAIDMVKSFEDNSLTIYDRLYISRKVIHTHHEHNSYFLCRVRKSALKDIRKIFSTKRKRFTVEIDGITVHVIKIFNHKTNEWAAFATNLPLRLVKEKTIKHLYRLRWEVENSFRDLTQTMKIEQWHSKFINGIRQELYVAFWLMNFVKMKMLTKRNLALKVRETEYEKPNFKLILNWITPLLPKIFKQVRGVLKWLGELIDRSMEKRKRHSREYRREIKSPASPYPYNNTRWNI